MKKTALAISWVAMSALFGAVPASAATIFGTDLASFSVLGASTVSHLPSSTGAGHVGVWSSGGAIANTGFSSSPGVPTSHPQLTAGLMPAGTMTGTPNALLAQAELTTARNPLSFLRPGTLLGLADLVVLVVALASISLNARHVNVCGRVLADTGARTACPAFAKALARESLA